MAGDRHKGDYLPHCLVPVFGPSLANPGEVQDVVVDEFDLIVVTQSCDLEHTKVRLVALCPIYTIAAALGSIQDEARLDELVDWASRCPTLDEFRTRVSSRI